MNLSNNHKSFIDKNRKKLSAKKIADKLNIQINFVQEYLDNNPLPKTPWYFYAILVLLPFILLTLVEVTLRLMDYGSAYEQWVTVDDNKYMLNREFARRYFHKTQNVPTSSSDVFEIEKHKNAYRVFILGGSSAAGYPYSPNGSFAKYVRKRLKVIYPRKKIEVVNCSMAAINSYTLLDMVDGIIEQKPDLVLVYAGHNEYYGAMGLGSMESIGNYRPLILLSLYMNNFRTYQLLRNTIKDFTESGNKKSKTTGTLMARMAKEQSISYNSEMFNAGINQFKDNLEDIISKFRDKNIPIIVGNLASNLKDQLPFISDKAKNSFNAQKAYNEAFNKLNDSSYVAADSLFRLAKDYDMLRFRAPEKINTTIKYLTKKYCIPMVNVDSVFSANSPDGIIGNELMTDHLHPTLTGYQLIGRAFFEAADANNYFPTKQKLKIPYDTQNKKVVDDYDFSVLDSTIAEYRIIILKSDWPYVKNKLSPKSILNKMNPKNIVDSLAMLVVNEQLNWEVAHRKLADYYLTKGDVDSFMREYNVIIDKFPFIGDYYNFAIERLVHFNRTDEAYKLAWIKHRMKPDAFSYKWIGIIDMSNKLYTKALGYLEKSAELKPDDAQLLYNLAGCYYEIKQYKNSFEAIERCIAVDPRFPNAKKFREYVNKLANPVININ